MTYKNLEVAHSILTQMFIKNEILYLTVPQSLVRKMYIVQHISHKL